MPSAPRPQPPRATAGREAGREAVEHLASALSEAGLPPLPARVWAALLSDSDGRMTAVELTEALQVSAAGVSGAVKYLVQVGWVRREREPGGERAGELDEDGGVGDELIVGPVAAGARQRAAASVAAEVGEQDAKAGVDEGAGEAGAVGAEGAAVDHHRVAGDDDAARRAGGGEVEDVEDPAVGGGDAVRGQLHGCAGEDAG